MIIKAKMLSILADQIKAVHFRPVFSDSGNFRLMMTGLRMQVKEAVIYTEIGNFIVSEAEGNYIISEWENWKNESKSTPEEKA